MKAMKVKDMRELTAAELATKEAALREEFFRLRFKNSIRKLENTGKLRQLRRDIARLQTLRAEKQG